MPDGGHLIAGACVAGLVEVACDLLDGKDANVALNDGASVFKENIQDEAIKQATGLPIVHKGSDHVSVDLPQDLSIGVGHETGLYKTPQGEMKQDTTGVQGNAGIPRDPLQVVEAKVAIGHTVDHFSNIKKSAAGTQHHEKTCTNDGIELAFTAGNRSTGPVVQLGHICTQTRDSSTMVDVSGTKVNTIRTRNYSGIGMGIVDSGAVDESTTVVSETKDGITSYSFQEFHGNESTFVTGIYNRSEQEGAFKAENGVNAHSWTDESGVQHSQASHEVFEGTQTRSHSTAFFGLSNLGKRVDRAGHVKGEEETSSSSDVTKNGVRVVSQHTEDATYHGERKTVDGTTTEEHLSRHKVVHDHKATTRGADTEVENVSSTSDGLPDLDKSLHHESEELVHRDLTRTHSWTEGDGTKHSKYYSETVDKGRVEAVVNGVRVVSQHTEDATYHGERKTVDGTTKEEHFSCHKVVHDHKATTSGADTEVEDVSSTYDGPRSKNCTNGSSDGSIKPGMCQTATWQSTFLKFFGYYAGDDATTIKQDQQGDGNGCDALKASGECDVETTHVRQLCGVALSSQTCSIHNGQGEIHIENPLFSSTVHGKMHYDEQHHKLVVDNVSSSHVTLAAPANCAIASATSSALQCVINKGYLDWQDCKRVSWAGVQQFCLGTMVQFISQVLKQPWLSIGLVAGLFSAFQEVNALRSERALGSWSKVVHAGAVTCGMAAEVAFYMLFATNPYLSVIVAAARCFRDACREGYDWGSGNLELYMAIRNVCTNPQLGAAGLGLMGAKVGLVVGSMAGPFGMGLGAAVGGSVAGLVGAFGLQWMSGGPADKDLQYAYTFLGVGEDSSDAEVDAAYRGQARRFHPDKMGGSTEQFVLLRKHYEKIRLSRATTLRTGTQTGEGRMQHFAALAAA